MSSKEPNLSSHVSEIKAEANACFKNGEYQKAYDLFSAAIAKETRSPALYSNRSAVAIKLENFRQAFKDAQKAVKVFQLSLFFLIRASYLVRVIPSLTLSGKRHMGALGPPRSLLVGILDVFNGTVYHTQGFV